MSHNHSNDATLTSSSNEFPNDLFDDLFNTKVFESSIKDDLSPETKKLLEKF